MSPSTVHGPPSTVRWFRQRPDLSNLVFGFTNRVARDVARTHPGKYVGALAYYWCENAPDFPLEPNVIPFLTADRSQGYDEDLRREELALQQRWASVKQKPDTRNLIPEIGNPRAEHQAARESHEIRETKTEVNADQVSGFSSQASAGTPGVEGNRTRREAKGRGASDLSTLSSQRSTPDQGRSDHEIRETHERDTEADAAQVSGFSSQVSAGAERRLGLYDYLYGSGFLIPRIHTRLISDNLRQARRLGFTDYFAEVNPNWGLDGPMPWLVAQLLQDPEQSREVLLEEYYRREFGDAAVPMRRFFERCEQQWMHQPGPAYWLKHYRNESQARLFPSVVCRELRALLDEAARQARGASMQARVKFVSDAFGVTERFVAFCEARDALNRTVLTRETHGPSANQGLSTRETLESHEKEREKLNRAKREDAKRREASDLSTLSSQRSTPNQGRVDHETHGTHENRREEIEPMAAGSALRSIQSPGEKPSRSKREERGRELGAKAQSGEGRSEGVSRPSANGGGTADLSTLCSRRSTADGRSTRETHESHEKEREKLNRAKREDAKRREASDLSTLSSQRSTPDQGRSDHEIHGVHERDTEADAAQVSGFSSQVSAGARYQAAREDFIDYTKALMAREPQALVPFRWEDYLRHEPPLGDGRRWTVDGGQWTGDGRQWTVGSGRWTADDVGRPENLLSNGDLHGPLQKPKRIGGLDYGVAMPEGWITTVEPAEGQSARIEGGVLRFERNKETFVYQWLPATPGARYCATVQVRGCVQPSTTASLTLSWLDERQTPLGFKVHRLPEGAWPEWVTLEVVQDLPAAARWIGTGVRVQHQLEGDWLEVRAVRLERVR